MLQHHQYKCLCATDSHLSTARPQLWFHLLSSRETSGVDRVPGWRTQFDLFRTNCVTLRYRFEGVYPLLVQTWLVFWASRIQIKCCLSPRRFTSVFGLRITFTLTVHFSITWWPDTFILPMQDKLFVKSGSGESNGFGQSCLLFPNSNFVLNYHTQNFNGKYNSLEQ